MLRALTAIFLLAIPGFAAAATIVLPASVDCTLYQDFSGTTANSQGQGIFAGDNGGGSVRRALLAFDLSSLPPDAVIDEVRLHLNMTRGQVGLTPVSLHAVLSSWAEGPSDAGSSRDGGGASALTGDPTWIHRSFSGLMWTTPGGDFVPAASATTGVDGIGPYIWQSAGLVADVQAWLANPATNFGWLLHGLEAGAGTAKRFASSEYATISLRPSLEIIYTPAPEPGAAALIASSLLLLAMRRRIVAGE